MDAEGKVKSFYNGQGWDTSASGNTVDAELFEDLRPCAEDYVIACRRKLLNFLPKSGDLFLDAASGPIQYPEYLEYSAGFKKRVCVDLSEKALAVAKTKLGDRGETVCANLLELPFDDNSFDSIVSLHTIYHIDKDKQKDAVRELMRVARPGAPILIVYGNPDRLLARLKRIVRRSSENGESSLYFFCHPLSWWHQFEDEASVEITAWRSLTAKDAKRFIPNSSLGRGFLKFIFAIEEKFPRLSAHLGAYPLIVLRK